MEAKWKYIDGYEKEYMVSTEGKIKSLKHDAVNILKPYNNKGYMYIKLSKRGIVKQFKIHRLVAKAFIQNEYNKPDINHIDLNPSNNSIDNLEWCTHKENMEHAIKNGRINMNRCHIVGPKKQKIRTRLKYKKLEGMVFGNFKILKYNELKKCAPRADTICLLCSKIYSNKDLRNILKDNSRMCGPCRQRNLGRLARYNNKKHKDIVCSI